MRHRLRGALLAGTCVIKWDNSLSTGFQTAAQLCAYAGGDLCTDSQSWAISVGNWVSNGVYFAPTLLNTAHWTASFADNDAARWSGANGGTGDDHSANSSYGYACCGGWTPANPLVPVQTFGGVKVLLVHNAADTLWSGAVGVCAALHSDICSDSQTFLLRKVGQLSVPAWTNSHADNDLGLYAAINGGTNDNTVPTDINGFACCPSLRPAGGACPVARTSGVCATVVHDTADATFDGAATACAAAGADLCSIAEESVLRTAGRLTVPTWSRAGSAFGASIALSKDGVTLGVGADQESSTATGVNGDQTSTSAPGAGAVYLFFRTSSAWGQIAYVKPSNTVAGDRFGASIALSADGKTLAAAAPGERSAALGTGGDHSDDSAARSGVIYSFSSRGAAWAQDASLKSLNTSAGAQFGSSACLSSDGTTLAAGAPGENSTATGIDGDSSIGTASLSGAAYVNE